jgi:hypothetical protein
MLRAGALLAVALCALLATADAVPAQVRAPLGISVSGARERWQPVVRMEGLLGDAALRDALHSGLPLRLNLRVELWRDLVFDRMVEAQSIDMVLSYDPLDRSYVFETARAPQRFTALADVESAVGAASVVPIRPAEAGRYYYLALLEVETLSLSDLEELRRWLRGDARQALEGRGSVGRAVERGLRRAFVRIVGLSARRYEARTPSFLVR